jgi:hypothetical protein
VTPAPARESVEHQTAPRPHPQWGIDGIARFEFPIIHKVMMDKHLSTGERLHSMQPGIDTLRTRAPYAACGRKWGTTQIDARSYCRFAPLGDEQSRLERRTCVAPHSGQRSCGTPLERRS